MKNKVKEFRNNETLTMSELARKADITWKTLERAEKQLPIRGDTQLKIAKALNKKVKDVFPDYK